MAYLSTTAPAPEEALASLPQKNPWLAMWTRPRETVRSLVHPANPYSIYPVAALGGIASALLRASDRSLADRTPLLFVLGVCLLLGAVSGVVTVYIFAALLTITGGWLGGRADYDDVKVALAWSSVPLVGSLPLWIAAVVLFRNEPFTTATPRLDASTGLTLAYGGFCLVLLVLYIWTSVLFLKAFGAVEGFSAWRALGAAICAGLLVVVPVIAVALFM